MLVFLMPAEVRRNLMLPPGVITADEDGPEPRQPSLIQGSFPNCECAGVPSGAFVRLASVLFVCDSIRE
jgi:hypothetical protein